MQRWRQEILTAVIVGTVIAGVSIAGFVTEGRRAVLPAVISLLAYGIVLVVLFGRRR